MKIYVINLAKDIHKYEKMKKQFDREKLKIIRFEAVDGKKLERTDKITNKLCKYFCTDFILGCGMSHIKIWQEIVKNKIKYAMIFEDDMILSKNFIKKFNSSIKEVPKDWDLVYLYCVAICSGKTCKKINNKVIKPTFPNSGGCYCLTYKCAKKLLDVSNNKVHWHIDTQTTILSKLNKLNVYSIYPRIVSTSVDESGSSKKPFIKLPNYKIEEDQPDINWYLNETLFRIPLINLELSVFNIIIIIIIIII